MKLTKIQIDRANKKLSDMNMLDLYCYKEIIEDRCKDASVQRYKHLLELIDKEITRRIEDLIGAGPVNLKQFTSNE